MKGMKFTKKSTVLLMSLLMVLLFSNTVFATEAVAKINNLSTLFMNILSAMGVMILGYGVFNLASGLTSHDTTQMTQGIKSVVAGILVVMAPQIVNYLK